MSATTSGRQNSFLVSSQHPTSSPVVSQYKSPVRPWVWAVFWTNAVFATVFSILCALVYQSFLNAIDALEASNNTGQLGLPVSNWQALFWGAAVSAIFAFIISILFHAGTLILLMCSFKSLGHPGRKFGRAFVTAGALFSSLHILNITLQFTSFAPIMSTLNEKDATGFNTPMLMACMVLGYISSALYLLYAGLVLLWKERPDLIQVTVPGSTSAPV